MELSATYRERLPELTRDWQPDPAPQPRLVAFNRSLALELGLDPGELTSEAGVAVLCGARIPDGTRPVALAYAGHQFGNYSPSLGDGRALLLGELSVARTANDDRLKLRDIHLKGSGRTPFARGGDGKATVAPMLREFVVSEFMHAVGVPTTRSLAVALTGEQVRRQQIEPGAVLTRVAASHIRVGTFEYAVRLGGSDLVRRLADYSIERHYPALAESSQPYRDLLSAVVDSQAKLVADWMLLGFIHGVMNTDNMAISGEGIDYGPCAFMDRYDPRTVFSSIDHGGRYAYGNQPPVAAWNLARLAETMLDLLDGDTAHAVEFATETVNGFRDRFDSHWRAGMARKLGLGGDEADLAADDPKLFDDLLVAMQEDALDWTTTFRHLAQRLHSTVNEGESQLRHLSATGFISLTGELGSSDDGGRLDDWFQRWIAQIDRRERDREMVAKEMNSVNPIYIPRNHLLDNALAVATSGEFGDFEQLVDVLSDPFTERPGLDYFAKPASLEFSGGFKTFCGT